MKFPKIFEKITEKWPKNDIFCQKTRKIDKFLTFLWFFWLLNIFDAFATIYGIESGYVLEANPLMDACYQISPYFFFIIKYFICSFALIVFFLSRRERLIRFSLYFLTFLYFLININHIILFILAKVWLGF